MATAQRADKMNQILCCDWLLERARESHLARLELPDVSHKKNFLESVMINPLLTEFCSVKMAGYWPHSIFVSLWILTLPWSINMQKENLANIGQ